MTTPPKARAVPASSTRATNIEAMRWLKQNGRSPVRWEGLNVFDRDIRAEKAATMLRRGATIQQVCAELDIRPDTLRQLARDYEFPYPEARSKHWPQPDDDGDPGEPELSAYDVWAKARRAAIRQRIENANVPVVVEVWPEQPPPVFYDYCAPTGSKPLMGADIIREVCAKHAISKAALLGPHRKRELCAARHEAAFRMVVELGISYPKVGRLLGGRDHTTILNSVKRHASADPLAGIAYRNFCEALARDEDRLRSEAVTLHFEEGVSVERLTKRLAVSRIRLMGWLLDEADRRRGIVRKAA